MHTQRYGAHTQRYNAHTEVQRTHTRYSAHTHRGTACTQRHSAHTQRYSAHTQRYSTHTQSYFWSTSLREFPIGPVLTDNTHFFNLLFEPSAPIGKGSYHSSAIATLSLTRSMQMELGTEKEIGQREQKEDAVPYGW